jgi:hypothetical protein
MLCGVVHTWPSVESDECPLHVSAVVTPEQVTPHLSLSSVSRVAEAAQ